VRTVALGRLSVGNRLVAVVATVACLAIVGAASAAIGGFGPFGSRHVGQEINGATLLPDNQWVSPAGTRILDNGARLVSSALSPDGTFMAALGWNNFQGYLTIIDLKTGAIVSQTALGTPTAKPTDSTVAADGPLYSADGRTLWVPQSTFLLRYSFDPTTGAATQTAAIALCGNGDLTSTACNANDESEAADGSELPSGMALSPDGSKLYVTLNGANALGVIDTATNALTQKIPVGNAPRQVVLADNGAVAYVSNEGGRPARPGDFTNLSDGTPVVANRSTGAAISGTVSVVDLSTGTQTASIPVGLQPTAMTLSGQTLFVANSNDDSISLVNTATNTVARTVRTNPVPGATVGSYANALTVIGDHLLVSIGRDNAIAEYSYTGLGSPVTLQGLIPTDWYPVQVQADPALAGKIVVTNDKGEGARGPTSTLDKGQGTKLAKGHNTYDDTGSVTAFDLPDTAELVSDTKAVSTDNAWRNIKAVSDGAGDTVPSVVPKRIGGPSPIKHVFVLVKENRTYDQVLGDLGRGNGDPTLAQFGRRVTPNLHAMAKRFGDFDNFYDEGTLSADGHNWIVQAEANDYVEKEFGAFYRSYPAQGGDALAYQRDGFLWNAAEKAGLSVRDYSEYANFFTAPASISGGPLWSAWYRDSQILQGKRKGKLPVPVHKYRTYADIPSLNKIMDHAYPRFDLDVPDQYRVDIWRKDFRRYEKTGKLPNLNLMWVPDDHTAGAGNGDPVPEASVADNDLAVGRIVSAISHSKFWKSTAIFVLEDDPQNGVDHVDGHRSVLWVASPYSRPNAVNNAYYSQINVVRTVEQILGIQPMNQEDHSAQPMFNAFTATPDFAPYSFTPNRVPLTLGATPLGQKIMSSSAAVPASERAIYKQWAAWSKLQRFDGSKAIEDYAKPAQLNRLDWYSAHNWQVAYPGDGRIYAPDQVPGRNLPAQDLDG
jgi:YVTN family beta-propeller protein